jgi:hypothetical protein
MRHGRDRCCLAMLMTLSSTPTCRRWLLTGNADNPESEVGWAAGTAFVSSANGRFLPHALEHHDVFPQGPAERQKPTRSGRT